MQVSADYLHIMHVNHLYFYIHIILIRWPAGYSGEALVGHVLDGHACKSTAHRVCYSAGAGTLIERGRL